MLDPFDNGHRLAPGRQPYVQESRHRFARMICHGGGGRIRQATGRGGDRLAALGLMADAVELWNSTHLSAIVATLRGQGRTSSEGIGVTYEDVARPSPSDTPISTAWAITSPAPAGTSAAAPTGRRRG
ncbi:Tn3 family transposase [Thermomonospora umbrina]|uniref:Tn3 family transposase n=1 Tax=Thermomonospora umbrina TaxID=111806 RepID=UPI000E278343|nr:Tn3 family transposase [Thermomonospora umbrina]